MRNLAKLEVDFVNVHASGGGDMIKRAKEGLLSGVGSGRPTPKLLAVTILTSMDEQTMKEELNIANSVKNQVVHLAALANENGADGVVCSVHEVAPIKKACGQEFLTMTPGIRLSGGEDDDQKRVATPQTAKELGSDYIVIGRSITKADNPLKQYEKAQEEWNDGASK